MGNEGFAGEALLIGMADGAEVVGAAQQRQIFPGTDKPAPFGDVLELHHNPD